MMAAMHDWVDYLSAFATAAAGFAALAALVVAISAKNDSSKAIGLAEKSLKKTSDAVDEATRARIDDSAPRVIVLLQQFDKQPNYRADRDSEPPTGEAYWDPTWLHSAEQELAEFSGDSTTGGWLYFRCGGTIMNEGSVTAKVRFEGTARMVPATNQGVEELPNGNWALAPGARSTFEWYAGHSRGDWIDAKASPNPSNLRGTVQLTVLVDDPRGAVADHIFIRGNGYPIEPVPSQPSRYQLSGDAPAANVYPTQRTYRAMGETAKPPPWDTSTSAKP